MVRTQYLRGSDPEPRLDGIMLVSQLANTTSFVTRTSGSSHGTRGAREQE